MLEYSQDPYLPGLSGNEDACIAFLKEIGIRLGGERWRRWIDLSQEEKANLVTAIIRKGLRSGLDNVKLERLIGEVYVLLSEQEGTELRDASEYSTLLMPQRAMAMPRLDSRYAWATGKRHFPRHRGFFCSTARIW